jgi:hypothetical protein
MEVAVLESIAPERTSEVRYRASTPQSVSAAWEFRRDTALPMIATSRSSLFVWLRGSSRASIWLNKPLAAEQLPP